VSGDGGGFVVLPLQGDTLLVLNGNAIRSIDRGGSFETTALFGRTTLTEVMAGHSAAGRLLMGTLTNATGAACRTIPVRRSAPGRCITMVV
jgi:hypothetical protein